MRWPLDNANVCRARRGAETGVGPAGSVAGPVIGCVTPDIFVGPPASVVDVDTRCNPWLTLRGFKDRPYPPERNVRQTTIVRAGPPVGGQPGTARPMPRSLGTVRLTKSSRAWPLVFLRRPHRR
jgi:hypothetical protein